jgi:hypothetical protein
MCVTGNFIIFNLCEILWGIWDGRVIWHAWERCKRIYNFSTKIWWEDAAWRRIILKYFLNKYNMRVWTGFIELRIRISSEFLWTQRRVLKSHKSWEFLDNLSDSQTLNNNPVPWNYIRRNSYSLHTYLYFKNSKKEFLELYLETKQAKQPNSCC